MKWILFAIVSYFLGALTVILDKYLLGSRRISSPPVYAFYVGIFGIGGLLFAPLGFFFANFVLKVPSLYQIVLSIVTGFFYIAGLTALYFSVSKSETSKVTPVVFSMAPIVTLLFSLLIGNESFSYLNFLGILFLISGGLLISFDLPFKINPQTLKLIKKDRRFLFIKYFFSVTKDGIVNEGKFFAGFNFAILAGFLLGISFVGLKIVYMEQNFFNGFIWSRFGVMLGGLCLLFMPIWRKNILKSFTHAKKDKEKNIKTGGLFVFNKILGGASSVFFNLAILAGSVTFVSSLISIQYVFVLLMALIAGKHLPGIFEERMNFWDWMQKIIAIFMIGLGMYFIS